MEKFLISSVLAFSVVPFLFVHADTVTFQSGGTFNGDVFKFQNSIFEIKHEDEKLKMVPASSIKSIIFDQAEFNEVSRIASVFSDQLQFYSGKTYLCNVLKFQNDTFQVRLENGETKSTAAYLVKSLSFGQADPAKIVDKAKSRNNTRSLVLYKTNKINTPPSVKT